MSEKRITKILVDLGCADKPFKKWAIGIDRQKFDFENFIHGDYLSDETINKLKEKLSGEKIDILHSAYSLCFNKPEKLKEYLPKYFALMSNKSKFIIDDFGPSEDVVKNHTHVDDMQDFFLKYFKKINLTEERKVMDNDKKLGNHFHWILRIVLTK